MKKIFFLSISMLILFSCGDGSEIGGVSTYPCDFSDNTECFELYGLIYPAGISVSHLNQLPNYPNGDLESALLQGDFSSNSAFALINYSSSVGCTGTTSKLYSANDFDTVILGDAIFNFPYDQTSMGEFSGTLKSDVRFSGNTTWPYYHVYWNGIDGGAYRYIDFEQGYIIFTTNPTNARSLNTNKLLVPRSRAYIYSGGVKNSI